MDWEAIETDQVRGAGAQTKMRAGCKESILQTELTGFANRLDMRYETKRGDQDDIKDFDHTVCCDLNILGGIGLRWKIMRLVLHMLHFDGYWTAKLRCQLGS